jgi:signal transduction histidine kinase
MTRSALPDPGKPDPAPVPAAPWARLPAGVLVGTWLLVAVVHLLAAPASRVVIWPLGYLALELLAGVSMAYRAWVSPKGERQAWWFLAASAFLELPGLGVTLARPQGAWTSNLFSMLSLATGTLVLIGLLSFPKGGGRRGMGRRRGLDSLIFAGSLLFLLWMLGVQGSLRGAAQGIGLRVFAAYLNAALLGGGVIYVTSYHPEKTRGPLAWLAASAFAWLAGISCWALAGLPPVTATERWIIVAGAIPLFQGLAAWSPRTLLASDRWADSERGLAAILPYVPVTLAVAVMGGYLTFAPGKVTRAAYALFLVIVVLLLLRMLQAIKDLRTARRVLEERVRERTTALEQAQDTVLRTERMNAMATLGAGLTHDLNNLLGIICSAAELMRVQQGRGQNPSERDLLRILDASEKAGMLTQRLMAFGHKGAGLAGTQPKAIAETLASTREILTMLLPRSIGLTFRLEDLPGQALVEPSVLEQVLVNLVGNAKDAMPGGGQVTLWLHPGLTESGALAAILEVIDSGPGIPQDLQELIFDAFFTTKPVGKGTGLGLASVRTLMEALGGTVSVESQPGQGTCFRLAFPLDDPIPIPSLS